MPDKNEPMNDLKNDPKLTAYAMGELSADEAREVEQLIADSPELTIAANEIRATILSLESAFADEPPLELALSEQQRSAIAAASKSGGNEIDEDAASIASVSRAAKDIAVTASRPWGRWLLAAAIGTVLIGGGVFLANPDIQLGRHAAMNEASSGKPAGAKTAASVEAVGNVVDENLVDDSVLKLDFEPMLDLVQSTVESDQWSENTPTESAPLRAAEANLELVVTNSQRGVEETDEEFGESVARSQQLGRLSKKLAAIPESVTSPPTSDRFRRQAQQGMEMAGEAMDELGSATRSDSISGKRRRPSGAAGEDLEDGFGGGGFDEEIADRQQPVQSGLPAGAAKQAYYDPGKFDADSSRRVPTDSPAIAFPTAPEEWLAEKRSRVRFNELRLAGAYDGKGGGVGQFKVDVSEVGDSLAKNNLSSERLTMEGSKTAQQSTNSFLDDLLLDSDEGKDEVRKELAIGGRLDQPAEPKSAEPKSAKRKEAKKAPKTWKRVKAIPNTTRLMVGDKEELDLTGMQVNVQVDGFRARVLIDYLYYNDQDQQLEGNFKLRLPEDSSLYYFAFGESANELTPQRRLAGREFVDNGTQFVSFTPAAITKSRSDVWRNVKEARMVPREQAAYAFRETVRRRVDPALVEWSGAGVFNAKVFPLAPKKVHRIVIGYDVNLTRSGNQLTYQLDLPESTGDCRIEINAQDVEGIQYKIEPEVEPVEVDHNDELHQRFTFDQRPEDGIRLTATTETPLLLKSKELADEFWATQVTPELPVEEAVGSGRAMFMLDTSLSSAPDKFNVWLKLLETTLANNRDTMTEFGVLMFSVDGHFWKPQYVANTADNVAELKGTLENLVLEGATDLYAAMQKVTTTDWVTGGQAPDLFLLSDGAANWGETNQRLIGSLLADKKTGSLFAYQTGMTGTAIANLRFLTGQTGGAVFSVASEDEIATASTAHRKRPWRLSGISAEGASDMLTAGRAEWVYPGQTLTVVGRGIVSGPMKLEFEQSGKTMSVTNEPKGIVSELASRLYGQISVGQLEAMGSEVFDISAAYARHFRVTGGTCSLLMLESEADYERFDIKPQEDEFVIKSKPASKLVADMLEKAASRLSDPKAQLLAWLKRLETMQGLKFAMPTALKLAIDDIDVVAVSQPLECTPLTRADVSKGYLNALAQEKLDYDVIAGQAKKRGRQSIDDSLKVFSSLIERNPGDVTMARDVAFTALELDRPAQAYHLLRSVAQQRPFQGSIYPAIGQCLAQAGQADMAIVYYEVALAGEFQRQGSKFRQIVAVDYMYLLRRIVSGKAKSSVVDFARARLETLTKKMPVSKADMLVTMMWNQDQTDVDLHVIEPSGEKCFYSHRKTNSGGEITDDITTGFGPEMYFNETAPDGKYKIEVKFFGNSQNRTSVKNKVYLTVFEEFGSDQERVTRRTIRLKDAGEQRTVMEVEK